MADDDQIFDDGAGAPVDNLDSLDLDDPLGDSIEDPDLEGDLYQGDDEEF